MALEEGKQDTGFGLPVSQVFAVVLFVRKYSVPEVRSPVHTGRTRRRSLNSVRRSSGRSQGPGAPGSWTDRRLRRQKVDECCRDGNGNKHLPSIPFPRSPTTSTTDTGWESPMVFGSPIKTPRRCSIPMGQDASSIHRCSVEHLTVISSYWNDLDQNRETRRFLYKKRY